MQNIPTPTASTTTRRSGTTVKLTEWTIGAYTLRKSENDDYTVWTVRTANHHLPRIEEVDGLGQTPDFGVSCPSKSGLIPAGAAIYATQIMEAAQAALTFNEIIAAS